MNDTPAAPAAPQTPSDRTRWEAFAVCAAVAALTIMDLSKINVGLPTIEHSLSGGPTELQLIVAGYALAFGLALVPAGRLGDIHSRKAMFVIGLSSFILASLLCAVAPTIEVLVIGRILQGVAAGIQMPQVLGLIQQLFQGRERGQAFGLFGAIIGLSTAIGPTLGGLLIALGGEADGWRLLFWMNLPLGILALIFAVRLLPSHQQHERRHTELDLVGILLLGAGVFGLMLPFVLTTGGPDDDPKRWFWLVLFVIAAVAFVIWERRYLARGKSPVVDFGLFRLGSYRNGILIATAYFAATPAIFLLTTLYVQQGLGLAAVFAGMISIPFALVSAWTSWIGGRHVHRLGRKLVLFGLALVFVGFVLALPVAAYSPPELVPWLLAVCMGVAGAGGGFVISPNQTLTLTDVPVVQGGVAGSVAQVGQRAGTAIGVAVASSTYFATLYRENGLHDRIEVYSDAFRNGLLVALGLVLVALVFGLLDLRQPQAARR
ncbi:EmrB/QacA subfamily drug resistance transporter [Homoserinimonas aerilata]|uniref:EmrB/QacA subfamily drug resistance transporter n=1 Tax=Homoserinimonas aerilata TaxID=1162970 RepID=A0A542YKH4_9MICO|nr:MFS transporter [Homoserinimonas aerilata]TQL48570.1 EmrB/QacA subfamily drug resistance transporter [Homoserinimonas aerilata]